MLSAVCFFSFSRNIQRSLYRAQCASLKHFNVFVPFGICSKWRLNQRVMKQKPLRNNVFSFVTLSWFSSCRSLPVNHSSRAGAGGILVHWLRWRILLHLALLLVMVRCVSHFVFLHCSDLMNQYIPPVGTCHLTLTSCSQTIYLF